MKKILTFFFVLVLATPCSAANIEKLFETNPVFQQLWTSINSIADAGSELAILPDRNKKSVLQKMLGQHSKYGRILKEARDTLTKGVADDLFQAIDNLQSRNSDLQKKLTKLKRERVTAPAESSNPFANTKKSIDEQIHTKIPREIKENEEAINRLKQEAVAELKKAGIFLELYQLEYFLVSAEGEELLKLVTMAGNMKNLQQMLENQLAQEKNNVDLARQYAGMNLVSLDAYVSALETAIENLGEYRTRLGPVVKEAEQAINSARTLIAKADTNERASLEGNIRINMRIISVAQAYSRILDRRITNLEQSKGIAMHKADIARNAYTTIVNGGNLLSIIQKSEKDFDLVMNFSMPELKTIYEPVMMNAFAEISDKIKTAKK